MDRNGEIKEYKCPKCGHINRAMFHNREKMGTETPINIIPGEITSWCNCKQCGYRIEINDE